MKRFYILLAYFMITVPGCAVFEDDNRHVLNWLDRKVKLETTGSRVALAPIAVPVGTTALLADMVVVHPATAIPAAAEDVYDIYWRPRKMDILRKSLLVPLSVVVTSPTFTGDWLVRSLFPVDW